MNNGNKKNSVEVEYTTSSERYQLRANIPEHLRDQWHWQRTTRLIRLVIRVPPALFVHTYELDLRKMHEPLQYGVPLVPIHDGDRGSQRRVRPFAQATQQQSDSEGSEGFRRRSENTQKGGG